MKSADACCRHETDRSANLTMSVDRGRPEVTGGVWNRRD